MLRALTVMLVLGVAGFAFVVSFEAISAFAVGGVPLMVEKPGAGSR
jgi:hypothetical protein